uniref:Uncharacterized protein n=1 Tax=Prolemur simus TaxID=1328070 RepID=A0A8C9DJD7_PROSS
IPLKGMAGARRGPLQRQVRARQREPRRAQGALLTGEPREDQAAPLPRGPGLPGPHGWGTKAVQSFTCQSGKARPAEAPRAARGHLRIGPDGRLTRSLGQAPKPTPLGQRPSPAPRARASTVDGRRSVASASEPCAHGVRPCWGCGADAYEKALCTSCASFRRTNE